ncbi:MAG: RrF2 family transcriptional regulator [Acetobacteraceae bacterium]|nr:RrF2 family transcriptional regulator [Acetobacteraceae bacterium]
MRLSTKARYGVRALCALAVMSRDGGPVSLARVAEREGISRPYLSLIFHQLRKSGYVQASRGLRGGYRLLKSPSRITVAGVVRALEGPIAPVKCLVPGEGPAGGRCRRQGSCPSRPAWVRLQRQMEAALEAVTLQSLIEGRPAGARGGPAEMKGAEPCRGACGRTSLSSSRGTPRPGAG